MARNPKRTARRGRDCKEQSEATPEAEADDWAARVAALPEPTPAEVRAIAAARATRDRLPARVAIKSETTTNPDGVKSSTYPAHRDHEGWGYHLDAAFGSRSRAFIELAMEQLERMMREDVRANAGIDDRRMNAALALVEGIAPTTELEAAMAVQVVAAHMGSLDFLTRSRVNAGAGYIEAAVAYGGLANKLARTMAVHVEALAKLRSGGKQTHEVRHVYVNGPVAFGPGARAATLYGGGRTENGGQPHEHSFAGAEIAPGVPLRCEDTGGHALSGPCPPGSSEVSSSWGLEPWSANGGAERPLHVRAVDAGATRSTLARARGDEASGG